MSEWKLTGVGKRIRLISSKAVTWEDIEDMFRLKIYGIKYLKYKQK